MPTPRRASISAISPNTFPGRPTIIIRNVAGRRRRNAMNQLGLNIGSQPDGLTVGYFTMSATVDRSSTIRC